MKISAKEVLKTLSVKNIFLPLLIGIGVSVYLVYDKISWSQINELKTANLFWIWASVIMLFLRNGGYIYRLRLITEKELSWKASFNVVMLWEFTSAVTPTAVGGTAIAAFFLLSEKIPLARAIAFVVVTAVFDNLFLIIVGILPVFFRGKEMFPNPELLNLKVGSSIEYFYGLSYFLILFYTAFMVYGLFIRPRGLKWIIIKLFSISLLKRWKVGAADFGEDIISASQELKHQKFGYWFSIFITTFIVWTSRFFFVNCLTAAVNPDINHLFVFARHCLLWIVILVAPTPGGSGIAEISFNTFFGEFLNNHLTAIVIFWRILTYWIYLLGGIILLALWLPKKVLKDGSKVTKQ
ncbi:MAG: hypothetical protein A3H98_09820 [Bacteroidetes bacterium RIFCSPLOWO2_02_FULL_36_8]|nr:MAG: hypothetical protein A3H98_09820 [Bacteroidetes bacterium RIFCSPLOWO2_02_FULL_36_8]OFY69915.1 MAG: hypothetical protein A3G23_05505 [Bacteroidetes bacterium RIFCSPLOWO2_12_FULL_37_12]